MKHKYWLFFKFNGWLLVISGVVLILLSISKSLPELFYFGLSSIYSGSVLFIIDYVIQIVFEGVNNLKDINTKLVGKKSDSENKSVENVKHDDSSLEPLPIYTKFETKKLDVKIGNELNQTKKTVDNSGLIPIAVLIIVVVYVVMIVSGFLK
jgi:hypothetical protein